MAIKETYITTTLRSTSFQSEWLQSRKINVGGRVWGKSNNKFIHWYSHYKNQCGGFPKHWKQNYHTTSYTLHGIYIQGYIIFRDTCKSIFITDNLTIIRKQNQPRCPPANGWMDNDNIGYKPKIFNSATHIHTGKKRKLGNLQETGRTRKH